MALTRLNYTYSGTNVFAVNFPLGYLKESYVTGRVNEEIDGSSQPVYRALTFITPGTVSLSGTLVNGDSVVLERTVPKNELEHDYEDGAIIKESNLDDSNKQAIMAVQEVLDGRFDTFTVDLDMGGNKVIGLATGTDATDAVNLQQMADAIAAASGLGGSFPAAGVSYDPSGSSLTATDVQAAIDEVSTSFLKNNRTAIIPPTVNNDSSEGYSAGSRWIDTVGIEVYDLIDATAGAAVWVESTLTAADLGALAVLSTINNDQWSGADLAIANGGSGSSSAGAARTAFDVYSKAESDALVPVANATRAFCRFDGSGANGSKTLLSSINVTTAERTATGTYKVTFTDDMPSTAYLAIYVGKRDGSNEATYILRGTALVGSFTFTTIDNSAVLRDSDEVNIVFYDD